MRIGAGLLAWLTVVSIPLAGCAFAARGAPAPATNPLAAEIDSIFNDPAVAHAHWGVLFRSLDTGETLYARDADQLFVPASNMKLLAGAAILETLGPDYRYRTFISAGGPVANGVLQGSLVVTGTGDPTFSRRFQTDPRDAFRTWADSLRAHGITRVAGGIIGVDTAFVDPTLGSGWMWDDLMDVTSAEFGALQFNESMIDIDVFPSRTAFEPAIIVLNPPTQGVRITNDTRTIPAGTGATALRYFREEGGSGIIVRGDVEIDGEGAQRAVTVGRPTPYLIAVLRETLREQGISVEGPTMLLIDLEELDPTVPNAVPIFTHSSPPLREILPGMLKPSQNQIAETMLRTVGREMRGEGSAAGGAAVVDSLFKAWEIPAPQYRLADASGLSRYDLLSPMLIAGLLEHMNRSAYRQEWLESLPIGGRDGTLASRMRDPPLLEHVRAKTGSMTGVRALSGYLTTQRGETIVFSIMINNQVVPGAEVDRVAESALRLVANQR